MHVRLKHDCCTCMKLFIDNNLSPMIAKSLHPFLSKNGGKAVHLRDMFDPHVTDIEFLQYLHETGEEWTIFSADRFKKTPERSVLSKPNLNYVKATKSFNKLALNIQISKIFVYICQWKESTIGGGKWFECKESGKLKPLKK